jgi:hypothetical protein
MEPCPKFPIRWGTIGSIASADILRPVKQKRPGKAGAFEVPDKEQRIQ